MAYLQVTYFAEHLEPANGCWGYKEAGSCMKKKVQHHHKEEVYDKKRKL